MSVLYYTYTYANHKPAKTDATYRRLLCSGMNGLLVSVFSSTTQGERQFLKAFRNHTKLTTPPTFGTSHDVLDLNSSSLVGTQKT